MQKMIQLSQLEEQGLSDVISDLIDRDNQVIVQDGDVEVAALVPIATFRTLELRFKRFLDNRHRRSSPKGGDEA